MPSADLLAEAKAAAAEGDHQGALELYGALAQAEPENAEALAGVARSLMALGQEEQARQVVETAPAKLRDHAEIASVRSALELAAEGRRARSKLAEFEKRLAADADDHGARIDLAVALNAADERARGRGRAAGGDPPRPRLERRGGAQAVAEVLRGLGLRRSGDPGGAAQAFLLAVPLNVPSSAGQGSGADQRGGVPSSLRGSAARDRGLPADRARCCCRRGGCRSTSSSRATWR